MQQHGQHRAKLLNPMPNIKSETTLSDTYTFSRLHKEVSDIKEFDFRSDAGQRFLRAYALSGYSRISAGDRAERTRTVAMSPKQTNFPPSTPKIGKTSPGRNGGGSAPPWTPKTPLVPGHYSSPMAQTGAAPTISNFTRPPTDNNITPTQRTSSQTGPAEPPRITPLSSGRAADYSSADYASASHKQRRHVYSILKVGFDQFTPAHLDDLAGRLMEAQDVVDVRNILDSVRCEPEFPIISFLVDTLFADPARTVFYDQEPSEKVHQLLEIVKVHERHHGQAQRAARLLSYASTEAQIHAIVNEFAEVGASAKDTLSTAIQLLILGTIRNATISANIKRGKQREDNDKHTTDNLFIPAFTKDTNREARHAAPLDPRHKVVFVNALETAAESGDEPPAAGQKAFDPPAHYQTPSRRGGASVKQGVALDASRRRVPLQAMSIGRSHKYDPSSALRSSLPTTGGLAHAQKHSDNDDEAGSDNSSMYAPDTGDEAEQTISKMSKGHASDYDLEALFKDSPDTPRTLIAEEPVRGKMPNTVSFKGPKVSSRASLSAPSTIVPKSNKRGPMPHFGLLKKSQLSGKDFKGQYYSITQSRSAYTLPAKNIDVGASQLSDLHLHTNTINNLESVYQYSQNGWTDVTEQYYSHYNERTIGKIARHPVHAGLVLTTVPNGTHPTYILERSYLTREAKART